MTETDVNETEPVEETPVVAPDLEVVPEETGEAPADIVSDDEGIELDPLAMAQAEADKWRDIAARSAADLENYRKRMSREKMESIQYANRGLLESLFPILDNFQMGLKAAEQAGDEGGSIILQGMSMVWKQTEDFLKDQGVEPVASVGQTFDPNVHEAVKQEHSDEVPEGQIVFEMRRGYRLGERLLRAATVVVSQGPAPSES